MKREQSLTLAPYWLDGHAIAAQAAGKGQPVSP
ncbi:type VI secretion system domain-containing protein, partial [Photorhabdus bodei]